MKRFHAQPTMDYSTENSFVPRDYQNYYLQKAIEQNTIICLGTGSGKTYITILLLRHFGDKIKQEHKKAIFLATSQPLVLQQSQEIKKHINFNVKAYFGRSNCANTWEIEKWQQEINSQDVLVFTPDIFREILTKQFIELNQICVIIFDECHWGSCKRKGASVVETRHTYRKIMDFVKEKQYHNKIRIVGTTASVVNSVVLDVDLPKCCKLLEDAYNAKIMGEFEFDSDHLADPNIKIWLFENRFGLTSNSSGYQKMYEIYIKMEAKIDKYSNKDDESYYKHMLNIFDYFERPILKPEYIKRMIRDLMDVHCELGLFAAFLLCRELQDELDRKLLIPSDGDNKNLIELAKRFLIFLDELYLKTIKKLAADHKSDQQIMLELSTAKLLRLLDILYLRIHSQNDFSILVFVDRVMTSFVLSKYINLLAIKTANRHITINFFVGNNNDYSMFKFIQNSIKNFEATIQDFKNGNYNLLISTSVLEEGIDIGKCNLVIRFHEPQNYREFVQSKGRARAKNSEFVIMQDEQSYKKNPMKLFDKTETFLREKFKLNKEDEKQSILPDEMQITYEEEFLHSKTGSLLLMGQAGQFIQRYIMKKGNNNHKSSYLREEIESEQDGENVTFYRFTLNLHGVTPLVDEVVGKLYIDPIDAFKSAMLSACKKLYEIGQLDDHFIPISDDVVVRRCNLINKEYSDEEKKEMNFIFDVRNRQRLMFEKQINSFDFFKQFAKSTDYNVYELQFISDDPHLKNEDERLALVTELELASNSRFELYSSMHSATIRLDLIKRQIQLTREELQEIGEFTLIVFKTAIPTFKKRLDLKFDLDQCLFKFAFLDQQHSIDYAQMRKHVKFEKTPVDEHELLEQGKKLLVRAIHTNTEYKLISANTHIYPHEYFSYENRKTSFNDFYKRKYDVVLSNQTQSMLKVEKANLNSLYSIYVEPNENATEEKTSRFSIYLPRELVVISSLTKDLYKKLNCLPPLIHRIKQRLILRTFWISLNKRVLDVDMQQTFEDIFSPSKIAYQTNIDAYIDEIGQLAKNDKKCVKQDKSPYSSSSGQSDDEISLEEEIAKELQKVEEKVVEKPIKRMKNKNTEIIKPQQMVIHSQSSEQVIDEVMNESLADSLRQIGHVDLDEFLKEFLDEFESIIIKMNQHLPESKIEKEIEAHQENQMAESIELKDINFDIWTNENSNENLISMATLRESLTTKSAVDAVNLERFEFLGDCFLKLITCCLLFHLYADLCVGELDILKKRAVCNKSLYGISRRNQLHSYIFADKFLPGVNWMPNGFEYEGETPNSADKSVTLVDQSGFRIEKLNLVNRSKYQELKPKTISDGIESLIGGVLVYSGIRNTCLLMKSLGIYSDEFVIDVNCEQKNWFGEHKYDPLEQDPIGNLLKFTNEMYNKFDFQSLETKIGYKFKNKALLVQAFKHVSHDDLKKFPSYERLEFYGDAVIDYIIARYFFDIEGNKFTPGQLTHFKQSLINNEFFGTLSVKYGLDNYLIYKNPNLFNSISNFKDYYNMKILPKGDILVIPNSYVILDFPHEINFDEGVEIPKVLGDIFESLMAAIFIDSEFSFNVVWKVLHRFMAKELKQFIQTPPKTFLQLIHQLYPHQEFSKSRVENQQTHIDLVIGENTFTASGSTKKLAKMNVAKQIIKAYLADKKQDS